MSRLPPRGFEIVAPTVTPPQLFQELGFSSAVDASGIRPRYSPPKAPSVETKCRSDPFLKAVQSRAPRSFRLDALSDALAKFIATCGSPNPSPMPVSTRAFQGVA